MEKNILNCNPNRNIADFYELTEKVLGKGTYGTVFLAKVQGTNTTRAVKVIQKDKVNNVERFKCEVDIMKSLDHPNILRLYDFFEDNKNVYLILEICGGGELFDRIVKQKYYEEEMGRNIFRQIIKAINYCHSNGVCHRDLKPENFLFMTEQDEKCLKLIDFGLSKNFFELGQMQQQPAPQTTLSADTPTRRRQTIPKAVMKTKAGTPFYIAPEVLKGSYDEKCDVWSAGVILYIILCGYPPFYGDTNKEILEQVKKGKLDFSGSEWSTKSPLVFELLKSMICAPEERFSAQNVLDHKWMNDHAHHAAVDQVKIKSHIEALVAFSKHSRVYQALAVYLARQLNEMEVFKIQQIFNAIDKNQAGFIEHSIILESCKGNPALQEQLKTSALPRLDFFGNGKITYSLFIASCIISDGLAKDEILAVIFKLLDFDRDGVISAADFTEFIKSEFKNASETRFGMDLVAEAKIQPPLNLAGLTTLLRGK